MSKHKHKKAFTVILFAFILISLFPLRGSADIGPKPSLTVRVENPPEELYYLDLLTQDTNSNYDNFEEGEREALNQDMLELLYSHKDEGWKPAFTEGTGMPIFGSLLGQASGDIMIHSFSYVGVPDTYRIIIVTESGNVRVSEALTRKVLQSRVTFDYSTGEAVAPTALYSYSVQFLLTCALTLLIEGLLLLLFGFKLKENLKPFLLINYATQVFLTLTVGTVLIKTGTIGAFLVQFPVELIIIITEILLFRRFLTGRSKLRRTAYALTANLVSWIAGIILMLSNFDFLMSLV